MGSPLVPPAPRLKRAGIFFSVLETTVNQDNPLVEALLELMAKHYDTQDISWQQANMALIGYTLMDYHMHRKGGAQLQATLEAASGLNSAE